MEAKITVHTFFKCGNKYQYIKENKLYTFSAEMLECMKHQYIMQRFKIYATENYITFSRVDNEIELFLAKLRK